MQDVRLIEILSDTAAALAAPDASPDAVERVLADACTRAAMPCAMRATPNGIDVDWERTPNRLEHGFVSVLGDCAKLALAAGGASAGGAPGAHGFAPQLERAAANARRRGPTPARPGLPGAGAGEGPGRNGQAGGVPAGRAAAAPGG